MAVSLDKDANTAKDPANANSMRALVQIVKQSGDAVSLAAEGLVRSCVAKKARSLLRPEVPSIQCSKGTG